LPDAIQGRLSRAGKEFAESAVGKVDTTIRCHDQFCLGCRVERPTQHLEASSKGKYHLVAGDSCEPGKTEH
jgi:hypothetical protein